MIRRSSRLLLEVLAAVLAGFLVLAGLAAWRLSQDEPVRLTFLTPYIVEALTPGLYRMHIEGEEGRDGRMAYAEDGICGSARHRQSDQGQRCDVADRHL